LLKKKRFKHQKITPVWTEANGQKVNFMKNIGKIAKTAHVSGKDWRREICCVFLTNYRATPHSSMKKSLYELLMNRSIRTKIPEIISSNSSLEIASNDGKPIKKKMKIYADFSRKTKDHWYKM
jgi:hypothetical protein